MHPYRIFLPVTFDATTVTDDIENNHLMLWESTLYFMFESPDQKKESLHVEGGPFRKHLPCLSVLARDSLAGCNIAVHQNECIPHSFGWAAIFKSEKKLYLLKNEKELSSSDAIFTVSNLPDEVCTLIFYFFLFPFISFPPSRVYEHRNCIFQKHNLYFVKRKHLAVRLSLNPLSSFP